MVDPQSEAAGSEHHLPLNRTQNLVPVHLQEPQIHSAPLDFIHDAQAVQLDPREWRQGQRRRPAASPHSYLDIFARVYQEPALVC